MDGVLQDPDPADSEWKKVRTTDIPDSTRLIGVECADAGGQYGILLSVQDASGKMILETGIFAWTCSKSDEAGTWFSVDARENWSPAVEIANHGDSPWGTVGAISRSAKWIWAENGGVRDTVYCRGRISVGG